MHFVSPIPQAPLSEREKYWSPVIRSLIVERIKELWGSEAENALKVFTCESGLNEKAINWDDAKITGYPSQGIAQINRPYDERLLEWEYNLDIAYNEFWLPRGWQPWTCATLLGIR